jgi:hypothetical protein
MLLAILCDCYWPISENAGRNAGADARTNRIDPLPTVAWKVMQRPVTKPPGHPSRPLRTVVRVYSRLGMTPHAAARRRCPAVRRATMVV